MQKDIIYLDVDDDITNIISKIKRSKESFIALVPPKRNGAMQSAVNLRLLAKMAKTSGKNVYIITHNPALAKLASSAKIPVAKTLESKPEIFKIEKENDYKDEIIEGKDISIGEHAGMTETEELDQTRKTPSIKINNNTVDDAIEDIEELDEYRETSNDKKPKKTKQGSIIKVPDFSSFRKKLLLVIIAIIVLTPVLIWAFVYAPAAKIIINAKVSPQTISEAVGLSTTNPTDPTKNKIKVIEQKITKPDTLEFKATGTADVGDKAKGTITIKNCDSEFVLGAGATFKSSSNGLVYKTTAQYTVPAFTGSGRSTCVNTSSHTGASTITVSVIASQSGSNYNIVADSYSSSSIGSYLAYASGTAMTGGTSRMSTVVTADDVQKAKEQLVGKSTSDMQNQLKSLFTDQQVVILESFSVNREDATSSPAIGEESTTIAKLTSNTTYTMYGINKSDLDSFLSSKLEGFVSSKPNQKIYDTGLSGLKFNTFVKNETNFSVEISSLAKIGPKIDEDAVKKLAAGKRYGDVQQALESISGVDSVDIKFSYFWVSSVPNDIKKITVEFNINAK